MYSLKTGISNFRASQLLCVQRTCVQKTSSVKDLPEPKDSCNQIIVRTCVHAYKLSKVWNFKFLGITIVVRTAYMRTEAFISKGFARAK